MAVWPVGHAPHMPCSPSRSLRHRSGTRCCPGPHMEQFKRGVQPCRACSRYTVALNTDPLPLPAVTFVVEEDAFSAGLMSLMARVMAGLAPNRGHQEHDLSMSVGAMPDAAPHT